MNPVTDFVDPILYPAYDPFNQSAPVLELALANSLLAVFDLSAQPTTDVPLERTLLFSYGSAQLAAGLLMFIGSIGLWRLRL